LKNFSFRKIIVSSIILFLILQHGVSASAPVSKTSPADSEQSGTEDVEKNESSVKQDASAPVTSNDDQEIPKNDSVSEPPIIEEVSEEEESLPSTDDSIDTEVNTSEKPVPSEHENQNKEDDKAVEPDSASSPPTEPIAKAPAVQPNSLVGISLLSNVKLAGSYDGNKQITLTVSGRGALDVKLYKDQWAIFQLPEGLVPYVDPSSFQGDYTVPGVVLPSSGKITQSEWIFDRTNNQIRFNSNKILSLNVLGISDYRFSLQFSLTRFPLGAPQSHTFTADITDSVIDLKLLTSTTNQWTLNIPAANSPLFFLEVPDTLSFGTVEIRSNMRKLYRTSNMSIRILHQNATGYPYQLTARATPLQSSSQTLVDSVFFTRTDGSTIPLNNDSQLIASGTMPLNPLELTYAPQQGLFFDLKGQIPKAESFSTTVEWTLIDSL